MALGGRSGEGIRYVGGVALAARGRSEEVSHRRRNREIEVEEVLSGVEAALVRSATGRAERGYMAGGVAPDAPNIWLGSEYCEDGYADYEI